MGQCRNRRTKVFYSQKAWQKGHDLDHNSFRKARPGGQGSGGTYDAPDMEWKVFGKCARVKDDDQQQDGGKSASEG